MIGTSKSAQDAATAIKNGEMTAKAYTTQVQSSTAATSGLGIASKAASIGVKALNIAMNLGVMLAISAAISFVVKGIDSLAHVNERAIESAKELSAKYEETSKSISSNVETVQGLKDEFNNLSAGVDDNGKNIALSADEYKRYHEIVKQLTDISPTLIKGYDDEGNAIVQKNTAIEETINLLKEQQKLELSKQTSPENNQKMAESSIAQYKIQMEQFSKQQKDFASQIVTALSNSGDGITKDVFEKFSSAFNLDTTLAKNGSADPSTWLRWVLTDAKNLDKVIQTLGSDFGKMGEFADGSNLSDIANAMSLYNDSVKQADTASKGFASQLQLIGQATDGYDKLDSNMKSFVDSYAESFKLTENTDPSTAINEWGNSVKNFVLKLADAPQDVKSSISKIQNLIAKQDIISPDEWEKQLNEAISNIANYTGIDTKTIKASLGIQFDVNAILNEVNTSKLDQKLIDKIKSLPVGDLQLVYKYGIEKLNGMSVDDFLKKLAEIKSESSDSMALSNLTSALSTLQSAVKDTSSAQQDYITISDVVNKKIYLTDQQVGSLVAKYPELQNQLSLTQKGWSLESGALDVVQNSVYGLQTAYVSAQQAMTEILNSGIKTRLSQLGIELEGIKTVAQAYAAMRSKRVTTYETDSDNGEYTYISKTDESGLLEYAKAAEYINSAKSQLSNLSGRVGKTVSTPKTNSRSSSSAKDTTDAWKEAFEKEYAELKYLREKDEINDQQYYDRLLALNSKYFKGKSKYLSEYRQYDEELYSLEKTISTDRINDIQHEIDMLAKKDDTEKQQVSLYKQLQSNIHTLAESARKRGIDDSDEYIQSLQKQWWDAQENIVSINKSLYDNDISNYKDYITERERYGWGNEKLSDVIKKEIALTENYYKQGLINYKYYVEQMKSLNGELYDSLKDETQKFYEGVRDAAISEIDDEIDALKDKLAADDEYYDNKIQKLQDQKDETSKAREEEEKLLAVEKARIALAKAESNKTVQTFVGGVGFVWTADETAVKDAQDGLNESLKEYNQYKQDLAIDNMIQDLEDAKKANEDSINAQIDNLEDLKDAWSDSLDISADVDKYKDYLNEILGNEKTSYADRLAGVKQFVSDYNAEMDKLQTTKTSSSSSGGGSSVSSGGSIGSSIGSAISGATGSIVGGGIGAVIGGAVSAVVGKITGKYASGTESAVGGLSLVGEKGAELRVLNRGDGIIPANGTKNLMSWANYTPSSFINSIQATMTSPKLNLIQPTNNASVAFYGNINVETQDGNVEDIAKQLKAELPNAFLQQIYKR